MSSKQLTVAEAFSESVLHDRHVVLGRELDPFCFDHWQILHALKSPLIHGGPIAIHDLQLAVIACSTRNTFEFYDATLRPTFGWRMWMLMTRAFSVERVLADFNGYIDDYVPKIPRWQTDDIDETKCPGLFLAASLWIDRGHDRVKVRRMPLGEMIAWPLAIAEAKGDPIESVKSNTEIEAQRQIEAEEAAGGV